MILILIKKFDPDEIQELLDNFTSNYTNIFDSYYDVTYEINKIFITLSVYENDSGEPKFHSKTYDGDFNEIEKLRDIYSIHSMGLDLYYVSKINSDSGNEIISISDSNYNILKYFGEIEYPDYEIETIGNFRYETDSNIKLDSTTKDLVVSPTQNSASYKDKNQFFAIVNNGEKTYQSQVAKLNIVEGVDKFETDIGDISLDKKLPVNYKLKIFNITSKVKKSIINKINDDLEEKNEVVNVFNVGMYKNDELIDIGEGKYLLNIDKPEELKGYTDIKISELDKDYNVINTEEPKDDSKKLSFTVNKLNNFVISGKKIDNPITKSPLVIIIGFVVILTTLTITVVRYRKKDLTEEII